MRALLLHSRRYEIEITGLATRPADISPEEVIETHQSCDDCIVALVCFEIGDTEVLLSRLCEDIRKMSEETGHSNVVLAPFAHLSSDIASSKDAIPLLNKLTDTLGCFNLTRTHFGSDKELKLDVFGHPGNVRFREYRTQ